jgi:hypothetical protein
MWMKTAGAAKNDSFSPIFQCQVLWNLPVRLFAPTAHLLLPAPSAATLHLVAAA